MTFVFDDPARAPHSDGHWACDYCGAIDADAGGWFDLTAGPQGEYESWDFCSVECVSRWAGERMEEDAAS